jgi:hypothetical protein
MKRNHFYFVIFDPDVEGVMQNVLAVKVNITTLHNLETVDNSCVF